MRVTKIFIFFCIALLAFSCKTKNDITYMQDIENIAVETSKRNAVISLQAGDELTIQVSGPDMDVVSPFNQNYSSSRVAEYDNGAVNLPRSGKQISGPTYILDKEGNIDFPIIGRVNLLNKSLSETKTILEQKIAKYIKNPLVNVKLTNFKVTILGEVKKPGQYIIPDAQATLLNALGMAGDATIYGKRTNVLVVRNINGEITKQRIDITDANFINSPFYYLKQNDVIYISPNKTRQQSSIFGPQTSVFISITSILVTIVALIIK